MASEKSQTDVVLEKSGPIATVKFVTPGGVNIFSTRVVTTLGERIAPLAHDTQVRFVVLRGEGKTFLAGADISEMSEFDEGRARVFAAQGHRVFNTLASLPQVTFAAINGHALGGGGELSLACDFRLMVRDARIGQPEVRLGLIPGWGGTQRLPRVVHSLGQAKRLLLSGEAISAEEAHRIGWIDEVVPTAADLDAALQRWFAALAPASPHAIARVKAALASGDEIAEFGRCFNAPDARAGTTAFIEKRKPTWAEWPG